MTFPPDLDKLTIWRVRDGFQANLLLQGAQGWRVEHGETVELAIAALFAPVPVFVPPCPVLPVPPCPVPA